jgi:hypothetical protein
MIENRMRLEREIMKGRQAVRKATRSAVEPKDVPLSPPDKEGQGLLKSPDALPIESEAEQEFAEGSQRFFKKPKGSSRTSLLRAAVGHTTAMESKQTDARVQFPHAQDDDSGDDADGLDAGQVDAALPARINAENGPNLFLRAWRTRSFPAIPSAFRSRQPQTVKLSSGAEGQPWQSDDYWSSDSSSEGDFGR